MRFFQVLIALAALSLAACQGDVTLTGPDLLDDEEEDLPEFDTATLAVHSPQYADIVFLEEAFVLDAEVLDGDGVPMEFDDITWELNDEEAPLYEGAYGEVDLEHGIHNFTVTANLPNGDRLVTQIGAVRVQGRHSGIYTGDFQLNIDADFQGTPITASCLGGLDFIIDMAGETIIGDDGGCTVNLFILGEMDIAYGLNGDVGDINVAGDLSINLGFFDLPVGYEGEIGDGELYAGFEGTAILFDFTGAIDASRVSLYVEE